MKILVVAGIHGDELNGIEAAKRLRDEVEGIEVVEVANPLAFNARSRTYKGINMNRCFPGKKDGNEVEKLAYELFQKVKGFDAVVDLHSGSPGRLMLPHVRVRVEDKNLIKFASRSSLPVVIEKPIEGSLQTEAFRHGIPVATLEAGEGGRVEVSYVEALMKAAKEIIEGNSSAPGVYRRIKLLSPKKGEIDYFIKTGSHVKKGQIIAKVGGAEMKSPYSGIVLDIRTVGTLEKDDVVAGIGVKYEP